MDYHKGLLEFPGNVGLTTPTNFQAVFDEAVEAGLEAGNLAKPTPMVVVEHRNQLDDNSPIKRTYAPVMDGVCGFAWVNIRPGNSSFANWLKANQLARKDSYYGGVTYWVRDFGQSYERKAAYAGAFASVLTKHGIKAVAAGRLD